MASFGNIGNFSHRYPAYRLPFSLRRKAFSAGSRSNTRLTDVGRACVNFTVRIVHRAQVRIRDKTVLFRTIWVALVPKPAALSVCYGLRAGTAEGNQ